ncbi:MAG TPA: AbrB/MazE/SpoVT family DNA-binding domain-containing protein [Candidatus Saccharimonadales bacterium]|nr:AbrB/MazE/SpoVT family DNA-binding domain-containing protein [Candidatus Saccharimonadales bacterium]
MTQKIIQIGNSTGIIIPKSLLENLGLQLGNEVTVETDVETNALIIRNTKNMKKASLISSYFLNILEKVNKEYSSALHELAQK